MFYMLVIHDILWSSMDILTKVLKLILNFFFSFILIIIIIFFHSDLTRHRIVDMKFTPSPSHLPKTVIKDEINLWTDRWLQWMGERL